MPVLLLVVYLSKEHKKFNHEYNSVKNKGVMLF